MLFNSDTYFYCVGSFAEIVKGPSSAITEHSAKEVRAIWFDL